MAEILNCEYAGEARVNANGTITVGGLRVGPLAGDLAPGVTVSVFVRRVSTTGKVAEVLLAMHDGYFAEALQAEEDAAEAAAWLDELGIGPEEGGR